MHYHAQDESTENKQNSSFKIIRFIQNPNWKSNASIWYDFKHIFTLYHLIRQKVSSLQSPLHVAKLAEINEIEFRLLNFAEILT